MVAAVRTLRELRCARAVPVILAELPSAGLRTHRERPWSPPSWDDPRFLSVFRALVQMGHPAIPRLVDAVTEHDDNTLAHEVAFLALVNLWAASSSDSIAIPPDQDAAFEAILESISGDDAFAPVIRTRAERALTRLRS